MILYHGCPIHHTCLPAILSSAQFTHTPTRYTLQFSDSLLHTCLHHVQFLCVYPSYHLLYFLLYIPTVCLPAGAVTSHYLYLQFPALLHLLRSTHCTPTACTKCSTPHYHHLETSLHTYYSVVYITLVGQLVAVFYTGHFATATFCSLRCCLCTVSFLHQFFLSSLFTAAHHLPHLDLQDILLFVGLVPFTCWLPAAAPP